LVAACGGDGDDAPLYLRGSSATPTGTPASDADGDTVPDGADKCTDSAERPGGVDFDAPDGCPDSLDDLVAFAIADIGKYWQTRLTGISVGYETPNVIGCDEDATDLGCLLAFFGKALYSGGNNSIYYDREFFETEFAEKGDFAPIFVLAHEWGHLVQAHVGLYSLDLYSIDYELQADCMAGVYARNANQRKLLALGDLEVAAASLLGLADPDGVAWYDEGAHGTSEERIYAFQAGFHEGLGVCASVADEAKKR
jgi:predicted metalloprotease